MTSVAEGALRAPRTPVPDSREKDSRGAANNALASADVPAASRGAVLSAHARTLDSRLRVAAQNDRQATRRAAAHVVQLARRIARLLPRVPTLLPVLPDGGRDVRVRHYVLQTQSVVGTPGTRILTISTHSVLRYGEFDGSGKPLLWNEYDPLQPVVGWDLEVVLERLGDVLGRITTHVESLEARVAERATTLNSLLNSPPVSNRPLGASAAAKPQAPPAASAAPAAPGQKAGAASTPVAPAPVVPPANTINYGPPPTVEPPPKHMPNDDLLNAAASHDFDELRSDMPPEFDDSMPELALIDLAFGDLAAEYAEPAVTMSEDETAEPTELFPMLSVDAPTAVPEAPVAPTGAEASVERAKRERRLFQHLRAR